MKVAVYSTLATRSLNINERESPEKLRKRGASSARLRIKRKEAYVKIWAAKPRESSYPYLAKL